MSAPQALPPAAIGPTHPFVQQRRVGRGLRVALAGLIPLVIAAGVSVATPKPNLLLALGLVVGGLGVVALVSIGRLEVTVTVLALYLGLMDGPIKLFTASQAASSVRDVLIAAVSIGALVRLSAKRERIRLPPLTGWVALFVALVLIEAFNPKTTGVLKILGGYRQNLEWIPFFFFGYALMRSHERFRKMFILLGVLALVNGVVATYQTQVSVSSLSSWGPGYSEKINGNINVETGAGVTGRKYISEGVGRVRPPGLGGDSGFGGGVGVIALPGTLALLATGRRRQRWYAIVLCLGSLVAVTIGLGRLQVVGAVIAMLSFALLSLSAGKRVTRPLGALLAVGALALPLGALFVSSVGSGVFSRYETIEPNKVVQTSTTYKEKSLSLIPHYIASAPFGFGLATAGPAVGFGGKTTGLLEGHGITAETQYNFVEDELGAPGLFLWLALTIEVILLLLRRLPRIPNIDIRIDLAAVFAVFLAHTVMGVRGAFMDSAPAASYFWFSLGIAAYWLATRRQSERASGLAEPAVVQGSAA
jgi:hypothetical protein